MNVPTEKTAIRGMMTQTKGSVDMPPLLLLVVDMSSVPRNYPGVDVMSQIG